jgi:hypothetical protein
MPAGEDDDEEQATREPGLLRIVDSVEDAEQSALEAFKMTEELVGDR